MKIGDLVRPDLDFMREQDRINNLNNASFFEKLIRLPERAIPWKVVAIRGNVIEVDIGPSTNIPFEPEELLPFITEQNKLE